MATPFLRRTKPICFIVDDPNHGSGRMYRCANTCVLFHAENDELAFRSALYYGSCQDDPFNVLPNRTLTTSVIVGPDGKVDSSTDAANQTSTTLYDALGRAYQQIDLNERVSETVYDKRGLAIQTRSELPNSVLSISSTVYDTSGRAIYSTGSFPEGTAPSQITGTHTIYDAQGRVDRTEQRVGLQIQVTSGTQSPASSLLGAGTVVSFSRSFYDDAGRVEWTENDYGLKSQTLYGQFGEVVESRSETVDSSGIHHWLVSRTIYDSLGRVSINTDRFLVPGDTPLGGNPLVEPLPAVNITKTIYDARGRTVATERYTGATVSLTQNALLSYSPQPTLTSAGQLESVSQTLYDSAGRVWRTISGRVPLSTLSPASTAALQSAALNDYPVHGAAADPYASLSLSSGVISDTLFDTRGRQYASLGHPLPAADVGLTGTNYSGKLVRPRTETIYDTYGQASVQRSGLAHVESTTGTLAGVYDEQSVDTTTYSDALGNAYRTEFLTGGTLIYDTATKRTTRTGGGIHSYTLTRFDAENRPVAEMQQTAGTVVAAWSATANSFVIDGTATSIPTKLYVYDADDRLVAVELPAVANPLSGGTFARPRYEYGYDEQGNQTLIVDPRGRETRFTFTDRGQQATRTLPLGFGSDGIASATDLTTLQSNPSSLPFTERMTYDNRGRQELHVSFEGVVTKNVYDSFGRLSYVNYYASETTHTAGTIAERWTYQYDEHGRKDIAIHSVNVSGTLTPDRAEETIYDDRGRIIAEVGAEGSLAYSYDAAGRMASVAVRPANVALTAPAKRITHYGYDILGRLASVKEDATPSVSTDATLDTKYKFDLQGRADTTALPNGVTTDYDYDALSRLDIQTDKNAAGQTLASYDYTVRADGKRTDLDETTWLDANQDSVRDSAEVKSTGYDWTYDSVGRLTDEVITHFDSTISQSEHFEYDLTGNRTLLERNHDGTAGIDEVITYGYDANDRLLEEALNDLTSANIDKVTTYAYGHTQQTSKTVTAGSQTLTNQVFGYNLQGRMLSVVNEGYTSGSLSSRDRTTYEYGSKSYRVALASETGTAQGTIANESWTLTSSTEFLADSHNHTGYTQTVRETTFNSDGTTKTIDYTFGNDEIQQRVVVRDSLATVTSDATHVFGHDGHGSVRVLYDVAGVVAQAFTFAAYGQMLAVHATTGTLLGTTAGFSLTNLGYSGEHFDAKVQQQYLRARFYDPANGRFNRLDPFSGNMQDPQSLHKYAYGHGDPVQGIDPTGLMSTVNAMVSIGIISSAIVGMNIVGNSMTNAKVQISLNQSYSRNRQITRDYASLYLQNPRLFKWAGMAALVSNQVGLVLLFDNTAFDTASSNWPASMTMPNMRSVKTALAQGNQDIYQDLYWQHIEFMQAGISGIRAAAATGRINALQLQGWEKIHEGDVTSDANLIWEGNKLLLENEQKVVLRPIFNSYTTDIDALDTLGYQLHGSPMRVAQIANLIPATAPAVPQTPFFRDAVPGGRLSNSSDRWNWIENFMLPAFERFEGSSSMRRQLAEMTSFPIPSQVFK